MTAYACEVVFRLVRRTTSVAFSVRIERKFDVGTALMMEVVGYAQGGGPMATTTAALSAERDEGAGA